MLSLFLSWLKTVSDRNTRHFVPFTALIQHKERYMSELIELNSAFVANMFVDLYDDIQPLMTILCI